MMAALKNLLCLLLIAVSAHCSTETLIPFIAWSSGNDLEALSSNQPSTVEEFVRGTKLSHIECFVVFKTSQLSFDDIVKFGGVYGEKHSALASLQSNLQSAKSSLWAGMHGELSTNLISSLSFNYDLNPQHVSDADEVSLDQGAKQLIVVILPEGDGEERRFMEQDKVISRVMATITQSNKRYIAFYTADHSSPQNPQMEVFLQTKREAAENTYDYFDETDANATGTVCAMVNNGNNGTSNANSGRCVMMCLKTPIHMVTLNVKSGAIVSNSSESDFANYISFIDGSCIRGNETQRCSDDVAPYFVVKAVFNHSDPVTFRFTLKQGVHSKSENCSVSGGFWTIGLDVDGVEYVRNNRSQLFSKFEVPIGASYACGLNAHNVFRPANNFENDTTFTGFWFSGIQAQVGGKFTPTSFASAYNCESYLSHVSLMGVVAVLILIGVLYCSIVFMFQMKSMDRFDDPRGPTISVENLH